MKVALIQFKEAGKKYYFSFNQIELKQEQAVVVETVRGLEIGYVYLIKDIDQKDIVNELKPILRLATEQDLKEDVYNQSLESEVVETTKKIAKSLSLEMKILSSEYTLDRKRLLIYFEAENRIDFRELVKKLSEIYHTRIELRQIGPRDAAKMIGGIGPCGLILCCSTFIGEFDTVSIKMAKNQSISLNPQKISGVCGKLLCCIKYEDDTYTEFKELLPDLNETIQTEKGKAKVIDLNILSKKIKVRYEQEDIYEWLHLDEITHIPS